MQKQKRWQLALIVAVLALTVYHILPTVFFYSKPLKEPISSEKASQITHQIVERTNALEESSKKWLLSFCHLLDISPKAITLDPQTSQQITLQFANSNEAARFSRFLDRAGALIPFTPAQLFYLGEGENDTQVVVLRKIPVHFDEKSLSSVFQYSLKKEKEGTPTALYRALIEDRALELSTLIGGTSQAASFAQAIISHASDAHSDDLALSLASSMKTYKTIFGETSAIAKRYFATFSQIEGIQPVEFIQKLAQRFEAIKNKYTSEKSALEAEGKNSSDGLVQQKLTLCRSKIETLQAALGLLNSHKALFASGAKPLNYTIASSLIHGSSAYPVQKIELGPFHPFIAALAIDWHKDKISLVLHEDVQEFLQKKEQADADLDRINALLFSEIASLARSSNEEITPCKGQFEIALNDLNESKSFIAMRLGTIAKSQIEQLEQAIATSWQPKSIDLQRDVFPFFDAESFQKAPKDEQQFCLVFLAPSTSSKLLPLGLKMNSLYVIAKSFDKLFERYQQNPHSDEARQFLADFNQLQELLHKNGFVGFSGKSAGISPDFSSDYLFEASDYYQWLLGATREEFHVHGTKRYATLEFSNLEQRLLVENKIDSAIHEDLLKWRDDYYAAQQEIKGLRRTDIPKPTKSAFWNNLMLSARKYLRGDDRRILRWGLDLSGGKTVQLELRDASNKLVSNPDDLRQGINELYSRVNKMGVSEVSIRQEGNSITLDFPGSQALSAAELIKASSMYFHVVNEKFGRLSPSLGQAVDRFLQEVWDEAVISNRTAADQVNQIAYKHLYGASEEGPSFTSESAKILYESGLRLSLPHEIQTSSFEDSLSKIALLRGEDPTEWGGSTHPLLIVFKNFALEGSNLADIRASYDPSKGNFLSFSVKSFHSSKEGGKINPQENLAAWTSQFSREKIANTAKEGYTQSRGWRMAVILNGKVISAPTLDSALKEGASITGSFTQREITQLEADLKAGSLTFSPSIISEKNVSPELGHKEKVSGIAATGIALALVIVTMIAYYHFGGLIASIAVVINLLIIWAALVNIGATLTLANLAGLILTVGMAVDANVLVFERIREEFAVSKNIAHAVHIGYKKAFSAILDSNLTTIIAALILLNFDSGPIKGFALTLIIGVFSSMFTALFLTRFYFFAWVKNPKNTFLNMASWIKSSQLSFLKYAKPTLVVSAVVITVGSLCLVKEKASILGMDFKGGYALHLELPLDPAEHYREKVEKALVQKGVSRQEIQIRELSPSNHVKLFLSRSLDQKGRPFHGLPQALSSKSLYPYQSDPRLSWIVNALQSQGISLSESTLQTLDRNWTLVSGQMSDTMRNNALFGLLLALVCILVYITLRFEFHYALSATLCLAHDLVFTVAFLGLLHTLGVPIHIDLNTIAALMTIVGYSLNDTIIVFDRIREDLRLHKRLSLSQVIELALNSTLSRTLMTSGTTLLVLIPMICLGGSTIFAFALVMAIGVIFGTLSSLFIAAPLMQYFATKKSRNASIDLRSTSDR